MACPGIAATTGRPDGENAGGHAGDLLRKLHAPAGIVLRECLGIDACRKRIALAGQDNGFFRIVPFERGGKLLDHFHIEQIPFRAIDDDDADAVGLSYLNRHLKNLPSPRRQRPTAARSAAPSRDRA
jgi:hypothetical protein